MLLILKSLIRVAELTKIHLYYIISAAERPSFLSLALLLPSKAASSANSLAKASSSLLSTWAAASVATVEASRALASSLGENFGGRGSPSALLISLSLNISFGGGPYSFAAESVEPAIIVLGEEGRG